MLLALEAEEEAGHRVKNAGKPLEARRHKETNPSLEPPMGEPRFGTRESHFKVSDLQNCKVIITITMYCLKSSGLGRWYYSN